MHDFRCYLRVASKSLTPQLRNLPCVYVLFRLISIAEYAFKICFEVSTYLLSRDKI